MFFSRSKRPEAGNPFPQPTVQQLYPGNKAIQKMAALARSGDPEAQYRLGLHHLEGTRNVGMAVLYLRDAAKSHLESRLQLAGALMHGVDDASSPGKSFCLFCSVLAFNMWSFKADDPWVMDEVNAGSLTFAYLYCMKKIFSKQEHEAVALLHGQVHDHCSMLAMGALGYCYAEGKGVPQSYTEAYVWFNLASAIGLRAAASDRDRFAEKMSPEQLVEAQRQAAEKYRSLLGPES
jgi:TPR repeat protein